MKRDWDKVRAVIERLAGQRAPIETWTEEMFGDGAIALDPEEQRRNAVRTTLQEASREAKRDGDYGQQVLNFMRINEDGTKEQFYDRVEDVTVDDWEAYTRVEAAKGHQQLAKLQEIVDYGLGRFGKKYQRRLAFIDMPPLPAAVVPT